MHFSYLLCVNCCVTLESGNKRVVKRTDENIKLLSELYECPLHDVLSQIDRVNEAEELYICKTCFRKIDSLKKTRIKLSVIESEIRDSNGSQQNLFHTFLASIEYTPLKKRTRLELFPDQQDKANSELSSQKELTPRLIANKISKETKVPLGILQKNEMYTEDMISILEHFQDYSPEKNGVIEKILCGGDGLTTKRGKDAQLARADAPSEKERLEGLIMKSEDWHEAVLCLQMIFNDLYKGSSVAEKGTLCQLKERFNRKNVRKIVKDAVHSCRDFVNFVTYGYTVLAAIEILGLKDKDEKPANLNLSTDEEKKDHLNDLAMKILQKYVFQDFEIAEDSIESQCTIKQESAKKLTKQSLHKCEFSGCMKSFTTKFMLMKHRDRCVFRDETKDIESLEQETLDIIETNTNDSNQPDFKLNYSTRLLREGLLDLLRKFVSKEGDGVGLYHIWKHDLVEFLASGHTVYAGLAFDFVSQVEFSLSERKAAKLLYNRTVNFYGGKSNNMPIDYALELLNGEVKPDLKHKYGTLTKQTIDRVGKSLKPCRNVEHAIDRQLERFTAIGRHRENFYEEDVSLMVNELKEENLFKKVPGRYHKSFEKIKNQRKINWCKVNSWLSGRITMASKEQIAKNNSSF